MRSWGSAIGLNFRVGWPGGGCCPRIAPASPETLLPTATLDFLSVEGSVAVEEGDSRQDIAKAVDAMTREAIYSDPVMDSSRFSDGYVLYTVQFLDGEVCITGALWTIE